MPGSKTPSLYDVAERLVRKRGASALTMDSLAEAAGVSRATAYRQLKSREALLKELEQRGLDVGERGDVRERIMQAAAQLFPRVGLEAATVENIAELAGVGSATVYRHFGDKAALIKEFLSTQTPRRAVWSLAKKPSGDLRSDLEQLGRTALEYMKSNSGMFRLALIMDRRNAGMLAELAKSPDRTVHACAALLGHYIDRGELAAHEPYVLARTFLGVLMSYGLFESLLGNPIDTQPERDAQTAVNIFLDGARARPATSNAAAPSRRRKS